MSARAVCRECDHRLALHGRQLNGAYRCRSFGCGCELASVEDSDAVEERRVPVETSRRRRASDEDREGHDFDGHLDAARRGVQLDCWCIQPPYVRWERADLAPADHDDPRRV